MKKPIIMDLGVVVLLVALAGGCQSVASSDEELIKGTMTDWKAALTARDLDRLMVTYSEDYVSTRASDRDAVRQRMTRIFNQGWMDNVNVSLKGAEITIDGEKAEFGPVEFSSNEGMFTRQFTLQKEYEAWLLVGSNGQEQ
jgi:hypothetical protein